jgi:hypothetical protein
MSSARVAFDEWRTPPEGRLCIARENTKSATAADFMSGDSTIQ